MKLTPTEIRSVLQALSNEELNAIVVGGQAVNLWASYYYRTVPVLEQYQPFASEDLDFYGGKVEAAICHQILGGKIVLNDNFDPSPNAGVVVIDYQDRKLRIDFLASVYGLSESEIEDTALSFVGTDSLEGVELKVLNPILCLEGKLSNLKNLPQTGRQDKKHAQMLIWCVREFLKTICQQSPPRTGLKLVERIWRLSLRDAGLSAWYTHNIEVESAVPLEGIAQLEDDKWQSFCSTRLPQLETLLLNKRVRYQAIEEQLQERRRNRASSDKRDAP